MSDTHADTIRRPLEMMVAVLNDEACSDALAALDALVAELADAQTVIETARLRHATDVRVVKETRDDLERERARLPLGGHTPNCAFIRSSRALATLDSDRPADACDCGATGVESISTNVHGLPFECCDEWPECTHGNTEDGA